MLDQRTLRKRKRLIYKMSNVRFLRARVQKGGDDKLHPIEIIDSEHDSSQQAY